MRAPFGTEDCDELIGRFCLDHDEDEDWMPEPEAAEVREARGRLLAALDSAALAPAGDVGEWLIGQRVAYRLEAGRPGEALVLLENCGAREAWCEALAGFALHETGRYGEAEAAFDRALDHMDPSERCAWTDLGPTLGRGVRSRYERLECGSGPRRAVHGSFWHLSDPLWLVPGRERRSEHLARRVRSSLQAETASGYGLPWGDDIDELTLRYGWPVGWNLAWRRVTGVRTERSIRAHRAPEAQSFAVSGRALSGEAAESAWELENPRPRTTWAPVFGRVRELAHQFAAFRRDGKRRIVAAFAWPPDLGTCALESGLFLADARGVLAARKGRGAGPLVVTEPGAPGRATLIGIEARCARAAGAARVRTALPPTDPLLSDLLLLEPGPGWPATLDAALVRARPSRAARSGESVVVYWEWYAPSEPADALEITLSLTRDDARYAGIRWIEPSRPGDEGRAVELRLPELAEGRYRLSLHVGSARSGGATSATEILIVRGSAAGSP